jgi:hypothetical protein
MLRFALLMKQIDINFSALINNNALLIESSEREGTRMERELKNIE